MFLIDKIAEEKIKRAMENGELQNLSGEGKPIPLEEDIYVPAELRAGYRLLKNAGYLPPELALRKEIVQVESLLQMTEEPALKSRLSKKLEYLLLKLNQSRKAPALVEQEYAQRVKQRFR
jgi:hypothetical protein